MNVSKMLLYKEIVRMKKVDSRSNIGLGDARHLIADLLQPVGVIIVM